MEMYAGYTKLANSTNMLKMARSPTNITELVKNATKPKNAKIIEKEKQVSRLAKLKTVPDT